MRVEAFENLQDQQRDNSLPVRRTLVHVVAPEAGLDRVHVLAAELREIVHRVQPAHAAQTGDDVFGDKAFVKCTCSGLRDGLKRAGE
jgi:hypothetical protein